MGFHRWIIMHDLSCELVIFHFRDWWPRVKRWEWESLQPAKYTKAQDSSRNSSTSFCWCVFLLKCSINNSFIGVVFQNGNRDPTTPPVAPPADGCDIHDQTTWNRCLYLGYGGPWLEVSQDQLVQSIPSWTYNLKIRMLIKFIPIWSIFSYIFHNYSMAFPHDFPVTFRCFWPSPEPLPSRWPFWTPRAASKWLRTTWSPATCDWSTRTGVSDPGISSEAGLIESLTLWLCQNSYWKWDFNGIFMGFTLW